MKILKRHYILIFVLAFVVGVLIRDIGSPKFEVVRSTEAYAPDYDKPVVYESGEKININTASKRLLMTLEGVGEKMAERIIEYRNENGGFETKEDIMKVSGIGHKMFLSIADQITVK